MCVRALHNLHFRSYNSFFHQVILYKDQVAHPEQVQDLMLGCLYTANGLVLNPFCDAGVCCEGDSDV
jgi:hypothetical protein